MTLRWLHVAAAVLAVAVATGTAVARSRTADEILQARRQRLASLSPQERDALVRARQRFVEMPVDEQQRLRALEQQIAQQPDAERLRAVMANYYAWLVRLEAGERAELASLPTDARLDAVRRLLHKQQARAAEQLSEEDLRALSGWLVEKALERVPPRQRRLIEMRLRQLDWQEQTVLVMLRMWKTIDQSPLVNEGSVEELAERLSPELRERLMSRRGVDAKRQLVFSWVRQLHRTAQEHFRARLDEIDETELARFFESLPIRERDELMALPPEEMQRELRMLYLREKGSRTRGLRLPPAGQLQPGGLPARRPGLPPPPLDRQRRPGLDNARPPSSGGP